MPRREFVADLQKAQHDPLPPNVVDVQAGEDDGQFLFTFTGDGQAIQITAMIPDVSEYPKAHEYMIFCDDNTPRHIASAVQNIRGASRKTVFECIEIIAATVGSQSQDKDGDTQMPDSQADDGDEQPEDDEDDADIYDSDHDAFETSTGPQTSQFPQFTSAAAIKVSSRAFRARIRSDLLCTKNVGFKVGHLGHLLDGFNAFVTVSVRVSKLGISDEAMQAWQIEPSHYLILILQYPNGYKTNEELQSIENVRLPSNLAIRVCTSRKYKPTIQDAIRAFTVAKKSSRDSMGTANDLPAPEDDVSEDSLKETFISKPLMALLEQRLIPILRYRSAGMDWAGAEGWLDAISTTAGTNINVDAPDDKYFQPEIVVAALPSLVTADHHMDRKAITYSFPLLAMQFMLRHFVRCTEFCLVCHRKLDTEVEAIKPYVCNSGLCLYQYMALGFGPSIEHEIMAQPYVVDLLVSFCYNSAFSRKLKDYPEGLALSVPPVDVTQSGYVQPIYGQQKSPATVPKEVPSLPVYEVGFDYDRLEIIFFNKPEKCPVSRGSWIVLKSEGALSKSELHCRISEVNYYPTIRIDPPILLNQQVDIQAPATPGPNGVAPNRSENITPATTPKWASATFQLYDQDFNDLDKVAKSLAICKLLDTLPTVKEIQEYLSKNRPTDLKRWIERISPAALSLLRWIIASNRACIMQVDGDTDTSKKGDSKATTVFGKSQERVSGMKDYTQFRFAMGAPDKEVRFMGEVRKTKERLNLNHQTIFAWHGSPLYNWHMIIREGLHYKNIDHGRAYGNGVYHAKDAQTSSGYSGMHHGGAYGGARSLGYWPNSVLHVNSAIALNEIVNAPAEFQSLHPFYVVQHLDWIQTRYLFVQCAPTAETVQIGSDNPPKLEHLQDPSRTPNGVSGKVFIPASAIKSGRAPKRDHTPPSNPSPFKKAKNLFGGSFHTPISVDDDDADSVATETEDLEILFEEPAEPEPVMKESQQLPLMKKPKASDTDFVPGELDFSTLPLMPHPSYAVSSTTKHLMKELKSLHKVQEASGLAELGWSIDVEKIENPYQWIVELHSFHNINPKLQLVADMKKQKIKSIVLEIRFNKDFPFTPPYVRVIRPRFLTFNQGGGGHIVMGGAMCMELLTNTGWSSVSSMESVLMQIRLAIASDPPAKLEAAGRSMTDYGTGEAADGYIRACNTHGWSVPPGFKEMAYGTGQTGGV